MRLRRIYTANSRKSKGQIVIILLLFTLVVLSIGLLVTQQSVTDLSTSSSSNESAQAFSAAEAGVAQAVANIASITPGLFTPPPSTIGSQSTYQYRVDKGIPGSGARANGLALEYPQSVGKELVTQFWLVDPSSTIMPPPYSAGPTLNLYFGSSNMSIGRLSSDVSTPAIEVKVIAVNSTQNYNIVQLYLDPNNTRAGSNNGFIPINSNCSGSGYPILTELSVNATDTHTFKCKYSLILDPSLLGAILPTGYIPLLVRVRVLYSTDPQPIALQPDSTHSLPPQMDIITSEGKSGQSSNVVQAVSEYNVVPSIFDYAIFSVGDVTKS